MSHPLLVDARWLSERPDVRVADVRWALKGPPAREKYDAGHIPGAVFVDLDRDLTEHPGPGRHPFVNERSFALLLARLGIAPETHVVAYDDATSSSAARFWFMLRAHGHARASLLDGGIEAWVAEGLMLSTEEPEPRPVPLRELKLDRSRVMDVGQVQARGAAALLDARAPERYRGEVEPIDKVAGHIPGSLSAPWFDNLTPSKRFRPPEELRTMYSKYTDPIVSCGSGVTACHDAFAIELAGLPPARLYIGSWSDWSSDPSRPIATGPQTG